VPLTGQSSRILPCAASCACPRAFASIGKVLEIVGLTPQNISDLINEEAAPVPVKGRRSMLRKRAERERCGREIAQ
jgi:hypothetical protein